MAGLQVDEGGKKVCILALSLVHIWEVLYSAPDCLQKYHAMAEKDKERYQKELAGVRCLCGCHFILAWLC